MVKCSGTPGQGKVGSHIITVVSKKGRVAPRIEMKKKLPLPPPFVVSRGYTPEYPWLGQPHPEPTPPRARNSPAIIKATLCILGVMLGLVLIFYGAHGLIRGSSGSRANASSSPPFVDLPEARLPEVGALVQNQDLGYDQLTSNLVIERGHQPQAALTVAKSPELPAPETSSLYDLPSPGSGLSNAVVDVEDTDTDSTPSSSPSEPGQDAEARPPAAFDIIQAAKQSIQMLRFVNLASAQKEIGERVKATETLQEAYDELNAIEDSLKPALEASESAESSNAVASPAQPPASETSQEELPLGALALGKGSQEMVAPDNVVVDAAASNSSDAVGPQEAFDLVQEAKRSVLMLRLINIMEAQRELGERVKATDTLQEAYDKLNAIEDGLKPAHEPEHAETTEGDSPLLIELLSNQDYNADAPKDRQDQLQNYENPQNEVDVETKENEAFMSWLVMQALQETQPESREQLDTESSVPGKLHTNPDSNQNSPKDRQDQAEIHEDLEEQENEAFMSWLFMQALQDTQPESEEPLDKEASVHEEDQNRNDIESSPQTSQGLANGLEAPVDVARKLDSLSHSETEPETVEITKVVPWEELNEDDKQDNLPKVVSSTSPQLADRVTDVRVPLETTPKPSDATAAQVADDGARTNLVVPPTPTRFEPQDDQLSATDDEWLHLQRYRDLQSRSIPLMHHVLHQRRRQQEARQQEQRATAYLHLLDLHMLQHRQEAEARQLQRQHQEDLLRLQDLEGMLEDQRRQDWEVAAAAATAESAGSTLDRQHPAHCHHCHPIGSSHTH